MAPATELDDWLESAPEDPFHVVLAAAPEDENLPVIVWGDMAGFRLLFGDSTFLFDQDGQLTKTLDWRAYHQAELDRHVWFERQVQYTIDAQGRFSSAQLPALSEQRFSVLATHESLQILRPSFSNTYLLWDPVRGEELWRFEPSFETGATYTRSLPHGRFVLTNGKTTQVISWNDRKVVRTLEGQFQNSWESPEEAHLVSRENSVALYDGAFELQHEWQVAAAGTYSMPAPGRFLSVTSDGVFELTRTRRKERLLGKPPFHARGFPSASGCFVAWWKIMDDRYMDGDRLTVVDYCQDTPNQLFNLRLSGHSENNSPWWVTEEKFVIRVEPSELALVDVSQKPPRVTRGIVPNDIIRRHYAISPECVVVLGQGGEAYLWNPTSPHAKPLFSAVRRLRATQAAFLNNGHVLALGDSSLDWSSHQSKRTLEGEHVALLDLTSGQISHLRRHQGHILPLTDGSALRFRQGMEEQRWQPWTGGTELGKLTRWEREPRVTASGGGTDTAFLSAAELTVSVHDRQVFMGYGTVRLDPVTVSKQPLRSVAVSGDARRIATLALSGEVQVLERDGLRTITSFHLPAPIEAGQLALDHSGNLLAVAGGPSTYLFDVGRASWLRLTVLAKDDEAELFAEHERGWMQHGPHAAQAMRDSAAGYPPDEEPAKAAQILSHLVRDFVARARAAPREAD